MIWCRLASQAGEKFTGAQSYHNDPSHRHDEKLGGSKVLLQNRKGEVDKGWLSLCHQRTRHPLKKKKKEKATICSYDLMPRLSEIWCLALRSEILVSRRKAPSMRS